MILITLADVQPYIHTVTVNKRMHLQHRNKKIADFQKGMLSRIQRVMFHLPSLSHVQIERAILKKYIYKIERLSCLAQVLKA